MNKYIEFLCNKYPNLVAKMKKSEHAFIEYGDVISHNPYHLEGSIWSHTLMVCKVAELYNMSENVKIACLLHDIGKIYARQQTDKRKVAFYGHAGYSFFMAIEILNKISKELHYLSKEDKIEILSLIALHSEFLELRDKEDKIKQVFRNNKDLYHKALDVFFCDSNGRYFSTDTDKISLTQGMLNEYKNIDVEKIEYGFPLLKDRRMTILCGLPCSGKSTTAQRYKDIGFTIISRDDIVMELSGKEKYDEAWKIVDQNKVDKIEQQRFSQAIKENKNIVIDKTNLSRKNRRKYISALPDNYIVDCLIFATPYDEIMERNTQREGKTIPKSVYFDMMKSFCLPLKSEGINEIGFTFR